MADTAYGVNANEAVKLWSRKLAREALRKCYIKNFMGPGSDSLIQIKPETNKGPGDRVRVTLRYQLTGAGVQGDGVQEGNEESLTTFTDDLIINQLRHAVRSEGKMTEQRIPFSIREEAMMGLSDWWADRWDQWFFNQVCGYTPQTDTRYSGHNAISAATGSGTGAVATGRAGVPVISGLSESLLAADDFVFMNGGVCMLDCRKMAFATMIRAVVTAATMAIESTGRRAMRSQTRKPKAPTPLTTRVTND